MVERDERGQRGTRKPKTSSERIEVLLNILVFVSIIIALLLGVALWRFWPMAADAWSAMES